MPSPARLVCGLSLLCGLAAFSCAPASEPPNVEFGATGALGRWAAQPIDQPGAAQDPGTNSGRVPGGTLAPDPGSQMISVAGRAATVAEPAHSADAGVATGNPTDPPGPGSTPSEPPDAGMTAPAAPEPAAVASLRFEVTTSPAGGRYQPKNIGAIWIEDESGNFVKSLQVWAGTRRRYLTGYARAVGGSAIDVTASATLRSHQTHSVSWDLRDRTGAQVAPGAYRVRMELTDANTTGKSNTVDFDTSMGPVTLTPGDAPSFGGMTLELQ